MFSAASAQLATNTLLFPSLFFSPCSTSRDEHSSHQIEKRNKPFLPHNHGNKLFPAFDHSNDNLHLTLLVLPHFTSDTVRTWKFTDRWLVT
jgi:hypothetical protein